MKTSSDFTARHIPSVYPDQPPWHQTHPVPPSLRLDIAPPSPPSSASFSSHARLHTLAKAVAHPLPGQHCAQQSTCQRGSTTHPPFLPLPPWSPPLWIVIYDARPNTFDARGCWTAAGRAARSCMSPPSDTRVGGFIGHDGTTHNPVESHIRA